MRNSRHRQKPVVEKLEENLKKQMEDSEKGLEFQAGHTWKFPIVYGKNISFRTGECYEQRKLIYGNESRESALDD